ncbi:hypothetical protein EML15_07525 [Corynebacterium sp. sy017]|uniref:AAA family ATPase n=1 Tax=unclassified Corynebacterium TaxID=2624378 RepID=UPI0011859689|nr:MULTISPECIES: AAA family ATPase [unclassified Corynebacterium]MBP3088993.1 hypothetical protein [Corynebacterium sp. sy017]TSD91315.1 hypothetical protein ELY17_07535 [Corynebacterium sp. SY003]
MKIHSIEIKNYRGIEHAQLDDLPERGVILISGENEMGKSTIMEAVRNVLNLKHGANTQDIKATQPKLKDVGPEVELYCSIGSYELKVRKRWLKGKSSHLDILAPKKEQLTGRDADARLEEIINDNLDKSLYGTLFIEQGAELFVSSEFGAKQKTDFSKLGIGDIKAVESALDTVSGSIDTDLGSDLITQVEQDYSYYFNALGKYSTSKNSPFHRVTHAKEEAVSRYEEAQKKYQEYEHTLKEYAKIEQRILEIEKELPQKRQSLTQLQKQWEEVETAQAEYGQVQEQHHDLEEALDNAKEREDKRREQIQEIEEKQQQLLKEKQEIEPLVPKLAQLQQEQEQLKEELGSCRAQRNELRKRIQLVGKIQAGRELTEVQQDLAQIAKLDEQLQQQQPSRTMSATDFDRVQQARRDVEMAELVFASKATSVSISAAHDTLIQVDDEQQQIGAQPTTITLKEEKTFTIADVSLSVKPGAADALDALEQAQQKLHRVVQELECHSWAEAEQIREATIAWEKTKTDLTQQRDKVLGKRKVDELTQRVWQLEKESQMQQFSADEIAQAEVDDLEQLRAAEEECLRREEKLQGEISSKDAVIALGNDIARKQVLIDSLTQQLERECAKLARSRETVSDEELAKRRIKAEESVEKHAVRLQELAQQLEKLDIESLNFELQAAQNIVANAEKSLNDADSKLKELKGIIAFAEGVSEKLNDAFAQKNRAMMSYNAVVQRAEAIRLLYTTLKTHREAAQKKYQEPLLKQLVQLAKPIFGKDVSFEINEGLQIQGRVLGGTVIDSKELSGGAQEQLALIMRFAIAQLAAEEETPIFMDDLLGASDAQRLKAMGVVISEVAKNTQVFILTCMPDRFASVANRKEYPMEDILC